MNKNMEMMKKLIEEKKQKGLSNANNPKTQKNMGTNSNSKGVRIHNGGGLFDK